MLLKNICRHTKAVKAKIQHRNLLSVCIQQDRLSLTSGFVRFALNSQPQWPSPIREAEAVAEEEDRRMAAAQKWEAPGWVREAVHPLRAYAAVLAG